MRRDSSCSRHHKLLPQLRSEGGGRMNYEELAVMQVSRAKTFSAAQTDAMAAYCQAEHDLKELQAENAKLRELVRHMHTCLEHYEPGDTISCEQCPYDNETWGCDYERLMAELGVDA